MDPIEENDRVALTQDLPGTDLVAGDTGTVVHVWKDGALLVEFLDSEGKTRAEQTVPADSVRRVE